MADENRHIDVIMGPYRDKRLLVSAADADAAINAHWARNPHEEYGHHDPLTEQQRTDAHAAAQSWAQAQWDAAQGTAPPPEPPPDPGAQKRAMQAEEGGGYATRATKPK